MTFILLFFLNAIFFSLNWENYIIRIVRLQLLFEMNESIESFPSQVINMIWLQMCRLNMNLVEFSSSIAQTEWIFPSILNFRNLCYFEK